MKKENLNFYLLTNKDVYVLSNATPIEVDNGIYYVSFHLSPFTKEEYIKVIKETINKIGYKLTQLVWDKLGTIILVTDMPYELLSNSLKSELEKLTDTFIKSTVNKFMQYTIFDFEDPNAFN